MENVTKDQILNWLGSDKPLDEAINVIKWLANNEYSNESLRIDIIEHDYAEGGLTNEY